MLGCPELAVDVVIKNSSKRAGLSTIPRISNHGQYHQHAEVEGGCLMTAYDELLHDSLRGLRRILRS